MDVKIITCHNVYNYGASLQAYALQETVKSFGYDCRIIDYNPWYLTDRYEFWNIGNKKWNKNFLTRFLYYGIKLPKKILFEVRKKCFKIFNRNFLDLTQEKYRNKEDLRNCCCCVLICGSDQIWNTQLDNGNDAAFFAEYICSEYRMSYAASIGMDKIPNEKINWFQKKLSNFNAISVREQTAKRELENIGVEKVCCCVDPVYLVDKEFWINRMELRKYKERYLLIYIFEGNEEIESVVKYVAKKKKLKIYSINSTRCSYADRNFYLSGPQKFIELVLNATLVITNSFHGVSFSIIFNKQFWVVKRNTLNSRISDMLESVGIINRDISCTNAISVNLEDEINYTNVEVLLNNRIKVSKNYLRRCLEEPNEWKQRC